MTEEKQYIITESMLRIRKAGCIKIDQKLTCEGCNFYTTSGLRKGCCEFDDNAVDVLFRSRPYVGVLETITTKDSCPNLDIVFSAIDLELSYQCRGDWGKINTEDWQRPCYTYEKPMQGATYCPLLEQLIKRKAELRKQEGES